MNETRTERRQREENKRQGSRSVIKWIYRIALVGGIFTFFAGIVLGYYTSVVTQFLGDISADNNKQQAQLLNQKLNNGEPFSVLLLGMDADEDPERARTDTIIVATINPEEESVQMVSIPRDTLRVLPNGMLEKINSAYAYGGINLIKEVVSDYLQIPIDSYATIDFDGLVKLVDAIGGITVDSEFAFTETGGYGRGRSVEIKKGEQRLDGEEALVYARMRKHDPNGDFGRQQRQREVIIAIVDELKSVQTLANLDQILASLKFHVKTDISSDHMLIALNQYKKSATDIKHLQIDGFSGTAFFPHYGLNVWVWQAYPDSLLDVQNSLRRHLGMTPQTELQENAVIEYEGYDSGEEPSENYEEPELEITPDHYHDYTPPQTGGYIEEHVPYIAPVEVEDLPTPPAQQDPPSEPEPPVAEVEISPPVPPTEPSPPVEFDESFESSEEVGEGSG